MEEWVDVTLPMSSNLLCWPGDHPFLAVDAARIGRGGSMCNTSTLTMCSHSGTHVDAPYHFLPQGITVDRLGLNMLVGPAYVLDLSSVNHSVEESNIGGRIPAGAQRLLIKTSNSAFAGDGVFHTDYVSLTVQAAEYIAQSGVRLLGWDYCSIASYSELVGVHLAFLSCQDTAIVENLDLSRISQGWYDMVCLPLLVQGGDGAPARMLLRKGKEP